MKKRLFIAFVLGVAIGAGGSWCYFAKSNQWWPFGGDTGRPGPRADRWARRIDNNAVRNLHKVTDSLYRGAQPDKNGFVGIERLGIKTVVNLRMAHSDSDELVGTSLAYEQIRGEPWDMDEDEVVRFLKIATDPARAPVFVHCAHGADRTGAMCAIYRIVVQGWSREDAIDEMTHGGYGYHAVFSNLVDYIRQIDVEKLRASAGVSPGTRSGTRSAE